MLYLIVEEAARRIARPEFARVVRMPGFCASLARTIAEFSSAGCDSGRLAALPAGRARSPPPSWPSTGGGPRARRSAASPCAPRAWNRAAERIGD